ncbi:O-antigen ligase family protein [Aeromonas jandaei]|uniref:O-antigen ligase family protein n=3 Tax=Aeromonas TaxID=642 RepID=A0A7T4DLX3_AERJA|nr:O-antigen ligase family protein [Aeromonas jandaei]
MQEIMMVLFSKEKFVPFMVQASAFLFGALALAVPSGYSYGPALLAVVSLFVFWRKDYLSAMEKEHKIIASLLLSYFVLFLISVIFDGSSFSQLDRPSRALMAALVIPTLARHKVKLEVLLCGFACGALIAACIAIYDKFYLGYERAFEFYSIPIQSGNISMSLGLFCLCGYFWSRANKFYNYSFFYMIGAISGLIGSFLSGSRGGWILLPVVIFSILMLYRNLIASNERKGLLCLLFIIIAMVLAPQTGMLKRFDAAKTDIEQYVDGTNLDTSLGIRFQLWRSAWDSFKEKPFFGWGQDGLRESQKQQLKENKITNFIYNFNYHAHNQYLEEMAKRGIIGLLVLIAMLCVPIILVKKRFSIMAQESLAYSGGVLVIVTCLTTADYHLSQAYFSHNSGISFFVFSLVLALSVSMDDGNH